MPARDVLIDPTPPVRAAPDLILPSGPNWTAVIFFATLGSLHLSIWVIALLNGHREGFMSLIFGSAFSLASLGFYLARSEIAIQSTERRVRLRTGYRQLRIERFVPFDEIRAVRVTLGHDAGHHGGFIELVCRDDVIECPPTPVANQEALCLAMTIGTRLVKVSSTREPSQNRSKQM